VNLSVILSLSLDAHLDLKAILHSAPDVFFPTGPQLNSPVVCDGMPSANVASFVGLSKTFRDNFGQWSQSANKSLFSENLRGCAEIG
jgi:hypothetical protein